LGRRCRAVPVWAFRLGVRILTAANPWSELAREFAERARWQLPGPFGLPRWWPHGEAQKSELLDDSISPARWISPSRVIGSTPTGIAIVGAALMVGSTYALSFVSLEFALASVGIDMVGMAAALRNAFETENPVDSAYEMDRQRFLDGLARDCASLPAR
jgi:hypothetical protein